MACVELLSDQSNTDACHRHHYLQMACEKLAKAYRLRDTSVAVDDLVKSHVGFAKFIQPYMLSTLKEQYQGREAQLARRIRDARAIAREIEKMAPAVDRTNAPENAEYPWEQAGQITAPCKYTYPGLRVAAARWHWPIEIGGDECGAAVRVDVLDAMSI